MDRIGSKRPIRWFLREWREKVGLTQEQLAERLETNKGQISKLENSRQRVNDDWLNGYAVALDIEPGDLLRDPERPTIDDLLKGVSEAERDQAISVLRALLKKAS